MLAATPQSRIKQIIANMPSARASHLISPHRSGLWHNDITVQLVPNKGLEPLRHKTYDPKSYASTSSANSAFGGEGETRTHDRRRLTADRSRPTELHPQLLITFLK